MKITFLGHLVFRRSCFGSNFRIMSNPPQKAVYSTREKSQMAPNEKVLFHDKLGSRSNTWGKRLCFGRECPVFLESMEERGSMYFHFADRPELPYEVDFSRNRFARNIGFENMWRFESFLEGEFGCFRRDSGEFVGILTWNRDGKCC